MRSKSAERAHVAVVLLGGAVAHLAGVIMNVFVICRLLPKTFLLLFLRIWTACCKEMRLSQRDSPIFMGAIRKSLGLCMEVFQIMCESFARASIKQPVIGPIHRACRGNNHRMLQRDALISARLPHLHGSHPEISGPIQSNPESSTPVGRISLQHAVQIRRKSTCCCRPSGWCCCASRGRNHESWEPSGNLWAYSKQSRELNASRKDKATWLLPRQSLYT
jgi:hypothetical protein